METTIRKIGNSVGAIIPSELKPEAGTTYKVIKVGDTIVMTPVRENLFANPNDWEGFHDALTPEDAEWDEADI